MIIKDALYYPLPKMPDLLSNFLVTHFREFNFFPGLYSTYCSGLRILAPHLNYNDKIDLQAATVSASNYMYTYQNSLTFKGNIFILYVLQTHQLKYIINQESLYFFFHQLDANIVHLYGCIKPPNEIQVIVIRDVFLEEDCIVNLGDEVAHILRISKRVMSTIEESCRYLQLSDIVGWRVCL